MKQGCKFCEGDFSHTVIKKYERWELQLFLDQYYPGRCVVKHDTHIEDLFGIDPRGRDELFDRIVPDLKSALQQVLDPDHFNYMSSGNQCRHLHLHVIPRYKSVRTFKNRKFSDENWNDHFYPHPGKKLQDQVFEELRLSILEDLDSS